MGIERRIAPRLLVQTAVRVESPHGLQRYQAINLSSGGIFLESEKPLAIGTTVRLLFAMNPGGEVQAEGLVKHHTPLRVQDPGSTERLLKGMGIAFLRIEGAGSQALADIIKALTLKTR